MSTECQHPVFIYTLDKEEDEHDDSDDAGMKDVENDVDDDDEDDDDDDDEDPVSKGGNSGVSARNVYTQIKRALMT